MGLVLRQAAAEWARDLAGGLGAVTPSRPIFPARPATGPPAAAGPAFPPAYSSAPASSPAVGFANAPGSAMGPPSPPAGVGSGQVPPIVVSVPALGTTATLLADEAPRHAVAILNRGPGVVVIGPAGVQLAFGTPLGPSQAMELDSVGAVYAIAGTVGADVLVTIEL